MIQPALRDRQDRMVVFAPVTVGGQQDYMVHRHLRAIDMNTLLLKTHPGRPGRRGGTILFAGCPAGVMPSVPQVIRNTVRLVDDCSIAFDFATVKNKKVFGASRYDDKLLLGGLPSTSGMKYRYGNSNRRPVSGLMNWK
ncbi:MAG: hypothetical protein U0T82_04460 [Bacteroidales bacterium]